ncbi:tetratricopeptide repeat protein [Bacteroidota bacterium]
MAGKKSRKPKIKTTGGKTNSINWKLHYFLLAILSGVFIYLCTDIYHIQDDAFITFRYVDNFIHGNSLVFNIGEYVEGFTSILWVLILSTLALLRFELTATSQYLSIGCGVLILFITYKISQLLIKPVESDVNELNDKNGFFDSTIKSIFSLLPSVLLTFTGALIYWSVSGMEATFYIFLNLTAVYLYVKAAAGKKLSFPFAVFMLLATLVRPEGALMFALILLHYIGTIFISMAERDIKKTIKYFFTKHNIQSILIVVIPNIILLIFRLLYYGYPLPNTFYAKTGISAEYLSAGINYFLDFINSYLLWGFVLIIPLMFHKWIAKNILTLFYLLTVANIFYIVLIGGDVLPLFRFFLPILPLIYILFAVSLYKLYTIISESRFKKYSKAAVILLILSAGILTYFNHSNNYSEIKRLSHLENELVSKMSGSGTWLAKQQQIMEKNLVVAATTIGALSYFSKVTVIDMLGLTDEEIAHNPEYIDEISGAHAGWKERKYNVDYILGREPDFILFSTGIKPSAYAERALFIKEDFINNYYPYYFKIWPGQNYVETIYKRRPVELRSNASFSDNPNYNENYVHIYNQIFNYGKDTTNTDKVIELCNELIKQAPYNFADSYRFLASAYQRKGDKKLAIESYKRAFEIDNTCGPANITLLFHYKEKQDTLNTFKHYGFLKRYNPTVLSLYGIK